ncbi:MAG: hypothetical protein H7338_02275 [Candidatus Sericytochromatia bacterium]|nr:hypothetical protein [Candidatus Sericytochromatia bacterium]
MSPVARHHSGHDDGGGLTVPAPAPIAIIGIGVCEAEGRSTSDFVGALFQAPGASLPVAAANGTGHSDLLAIRVMPLQVAGLADRLPADASLRQAAHEALAVAGGIAAARTGVFIGIPGQDAGLSGTTRHSDGLAALNAAARALTAGECETALVLTAGPAIAMVLQRLDAARTTHRRIYASLIDVPPAETAARWGTGSGHRDLSGQFEPSATASGLLHVASAALSLFHRTLPDGRPWLIRNPVRTAQVSLADPSGVWQSIELLEETDSAGGWAQSECLPIIRLYTGADRLALIRALEMDLAGGDGPVRLAIVAPDGLTNDKQRLRALDVLRQTGDEKTALTIADGVYYRRAPIGGELALVFPGSAVGYPGMGRSLLHVWPELIDQLADQSNGADAAIGWAYAAQPAHAPNLSQRLRSVCVLSLLHRFFSDTVLGLRPQAAIGLSLGETNALFALGVWQDPDSLYDASDRAGMFSKYLAGTFEAARQTWGLPATAAVTWTNWRVAADRRDVEALIADEPRVHVLIVNTPDDMVFGGDDAACQRIADRIGRHRCLALGFDLTVHCPELAPVADVWRRCHHRETKPVPGVRFYTHATGSHYEPTADLIAEHLTTQALQTIELPVVIENAWRDGVRIFVEHGPQASTTACITRILGERDHLAVSLDRATGSPLQHLGNTIARLAVAGVAIDIAAYNRRAEQLKAPSPGFAIQPATAAALPSFRHGPPRDADGRQQMVPAPWLPPITSPGDAPEAGAITPPTTDMPPAGPEDHPLGQIYAAHVLAQTNAHQDLMAGLAAQGEAHRRYIAAAQRGLQAFAVAGSPSPSA